MTKKNIKLICYVAIALFFFLRFFLDPLDALSYAVSLAALIDIAYDKFLWRLNPLEKTPKIYGVYDETSYSTYNGGYHYTAKVVIRQTLSSITVYEEVDGAGYSESITAALVKPSSDGIWNLYYTYRTYPAVSNQDDMHEGTVILCIKNSNELSGRYFTNRVNPTQGNTLLVKRAR